MNRVSAALVLGAVMVPTGSACSTPDAVPDGPTIVVTTSILGDVVASIAGEDARVDVLVPPGQSEHTFQASPQQVRAITDADLVVAFGLGLEAGLDDVLESAGGDRVLEIGPLLDPIPLDEDREAEDGETHAPDDGHGHEGFDPHVWLDPMRMASAAEVITDALLGISPPDRANGIRERATSTVAEITDAHDQAVGLLDAIPEERRLLVTDHEALGYFAERYGFRLIGSLVPGTSTDAAPSAADVAALAEVVADLGVPAVFVDTAGSDRLAEALAAEVPGVQVVSLFIGSLGPSGSGADTYPSLIVENARRVAQALG